MTEQFDVIVIGGGASGLMAAGRAAQQGARVLLLEKNEVLGKKLCITGGGRCNITHAEEDVHQLLAHYGSASSFLFSPFSQFGVQDTFSFFTERGLPLVVEARKRAFPHTHRATDVYDVLASYIRTGQVTVRLRAAVTEVLREGDVIVGVSIGKEEFRARAFIFATGGMSHPETGSTGDGFRWLRELGCVVVQPTPTLVPITLRDRWVKQLSGNSLDDARIQLFVDGTRAFSVRGRVLFTHFGLSGPTILNASAKISDLLHEGEVTGTIDLYPGIDHGSLDQELVAYLDQNKNKQIKNAFRGFAPHGCADVLLTLAEVDGNLPVHSLLKDSRKYLVQFLKAVPIYIEGLMGNDLAIVSDGGLALSEIDAKTLRVKRFQNVFATGDLLHIRRPSGGFSLQLCWTTGFVAGTSAALFI